MNSDICSHYIIQDDFMVYCGTKTDSKCDNCNARTCESCMVKKCSKCYKNLICKNCTSILLCKNCKNK